MPPQLNINDLYKLQQQKKDKRKISFDRVLELVHARIRNVSGYGGLNTFYEVPGMMLGYPLYNIEECTVYVVKALRKNGFLVQLLPPPHVCVLYVSWDPNDVNPKVVTAAPKAITQETVKQQLLRLF